MLGREVESRSMRVEPRCMGVEPRCMGMEPRCMGVEYAVKRDRVSYISFSMRNNHFIGTVPCWRQSSAAPTPERP